MSNQNIDTNAITVAQEIPGIAPDATQNTFTSLVPLILIFVVFYFLLIRPQEKKRREQEEMVSTVKKGEEVLTQSGIYGVVTKVSDTEPTVEISIAKDVDVKILKSSISTIISRKDVTAKLADKNRKVKK